jgi:translation elongation factor EF-Tu-like GTPase
MGLKIKSSGSSGPSGPGSGAIAANWKNKDYSRIVTIENGAMEMTKREFKFEVSLNKLEEGHSAWALFELDNTKQLLNHTTDIYTAMLTAVKFRADVKSNDKVKTNVATKLTLTLELETASTSSGTTPGSR